MVSLINWARYLIELLPNASYLVNVPLFYTISHNSLHNFFPPAITGWDSLDLDVQNSVSRPTFKPKIRSTLFPHTHNRLFDFSSPRLHLLITPAVDLGFLVLENICLKLIVVRRLFASAVLYLN